MWHDNRAYFRGILNVTVKLAFVHLFGAESVSTGTPIVDFYFCVFEWRHAGFAKIANLK